LPLICKVFTQPEGEFGSLPTTRREVGAEWTEHLVMGRAFFPAKAGLATGASDSVHGLSALGRFAKEPEERQRADNHSENFLCQVVGAVGLHPVAREISPGLTWPGSRWTSPPRVTRRSSLSVAVHVNKDDFPQPADD
jgi:hypothetical protein